MVHKFCENILFLSFGGEMEQKNHLKVKSLGFFNESMMLRTNDSQNLKRVNE